MATKKKDKQTMDEYVRDQGMYGNYVPQNVRDALKRDTARRKASSGTTATKRGLLPSGRVSTAKGKSGGLKDEISGKKRKK